MEKMLKTKIVFKHELEVNWLKSSYVPLNGEQVIYDAEIDANGNTLELPLGRSVPYSYPRVQIGDGVRTVNQLPFCDDLQKKIEVVIPFDGSASPTGMESIEGNDDMIYSALEIGPTYIDGYSDNGNFHGATTETTFAEFFKDAVIGETYVLNYRPMSGYEGETYLSIGQKQVKPGESFVYTSEIANQGIYLEGIFTDEMYIDHDGGAYDISISSLKTIEQLIYDGIDKGEKNSKNIETLNKQVQTIESDLSQKEDKYEKISTNLFFAEKLADGHTFEWIPEFNNLYVDSNSWNEETTVSLQQICPGIQVGMTYTGSYNSDGVLYLVYDGYRTINFASTFTVTESLLNATFRFELYQQWVEEENNSFPIPTDFYNISLNEGSTVLPYEPAGNLNLSQTLDKIAEDIDNLAPVAKTGSYNDLINKPTIPTDYIPNSQKGAANGVATLGADGKVVSTQLPSLAAEDVLNIVVPESGDNYAPNTIGALLTGIEDMIKKYVNEAILGGKW